MLIPLWPGRFCFTGYEAVTERKRASGFVLMDAAFAADAKFVRLSRKADDPVDFAASVGVWWMLLADCRRAKSPEVDWDDYTEYEVQVEKLRAAHLLNEHGFDPEAFERWAPAYRSVSERTPGTKGDGGVPKGTQSTETSGHINSGQVPNGVGGAGEGGSFMAWKPKDPENGAGLWKGQGLHDGRHGESCPVCFPPRPEPAPSSKKGRAA